MNIGPGKILVSTPSITGPDFNKVVIFITEYNQKGAMGLVVNTIFHRVFNELTEFKYSLPLPLYTGGPVEKESLFFLHRRPDLIEGGTRVIDSTYMGGDFKKAVQYLTDGALSKNDIKLFIGYCGWDNGDLEAEIAEGSWLVCDTTAEMVFNADVATLWQQLHKAENG
jgi:putative transcriptional regulator